MTPTTLKHWRSKHKLTQVDFALKLGVSRETVSNWERGNTPVPKWLRYVTMYLHTLASRKNSMLKLEATQ